MRRLHTLITVLVMLALAGCSRFWPSDYFRSMDTNGDGSLDLQEWMSVYGPHEHSWEKCSGKDFEPADCNGDLMLSWPEYHSARFKSDFCGDAQAHLTVYQKPRLDPATGRYVTLPPACRIDLSKLTQSPLALAASGPTPSMCESFGSPAEE